ncbi:MAG TPA: UvrD-helicase domain-containing protein [Prolixibacteraceae bacterium]|jgi:ATP-dependent exoDNAse (exonuclease V) beta subunit
MSQLKVYKASAGSGKTFRLAVEYMKLALTADTNYRHILAVTFTNKATAEMKSRIIGELFNLAKGNNSVYMDVLTKELRWPALRVQKQSQLVLKRILHDYSRFSISTIDSFFQRVIKAFNRELGINAAYNVELDEMSILEEAVDRLIQSVETDPNLLAWLDAFASEKIREGKGWNLKKDMIRLGNEIYNETFKSLTEELYDKLNDRAFLKEYRAKLYKIIAQYENRLKTLGQEGLNLMDLESLTHDDFKSKGSGPAAGFRKMKELSFTLNITTLRSTTEISAWVTASVKEPHKSRLEQFAREKLMPRMVEAVGLVESQSRNYLTARLIISQLYTLGILVDLRKAVKEICREKGVVLISDSGHLLKTVIAESETPFVYEKTGAIYSHFMIDEFQDTSGLQWNNFKPLIGNSLSEDNLGMVVGDVKQAIYRWRSGDWRLLAGKLGESFPGFGLQNEVLNSNWRSHGKVIRFNNTLFRLIPELLQTHIEGELLAADIAENPVEITIPQVYADSVQEISNKAVTDLGYIRVKFLESKADLKVANEELILSELVASVKSLQDKGVRAGEMAILVRSRGEARQVADLFLYQKGLPENGTYNFEVLSSESLYIISSEVVAFIIAILTSFLNPDDQVVKAEANYLYYRKIFPQLKKLRKVPRLLDEDQSIGPAGSDLNFRLNLFPDANDLKSKGTAAYEPETFQQFEQMNRPGNELMHFLTGKRFNELIAGKPIPEIIYSLCQKFNLFSLPNELAYLQAFVDQISLFERTQASELTSFLNWWSENGDRFTIPVSDSIDAITVLTIHKSKGLEFTHVFVPFFNWSIHPQATPDRAPLLWCKPEIEPFSDMELVPVRFKAEVGNSIFYREYFTEKFNTYIDNLNLMYVVFTRAKAALWVWASYSNGLKTVGDLLKQAVEKQELMGSCGLKREESVLLSDSYDPEKQLFELGEITILPQEKKENGQKVKNVKLSEFEFADFRQFLNIKKRGEDFFTWDDKKKSGINNGKLIHDILSLIDTTADIEKAVRRIQLDGKMDAVKAQSMKAQLTQLLNNPEVKPWFDGTYRVVNERNVLTGANGVKRPDRILIGPEEVVIIDYKSGEVESENYKYQLRTYIRELQNCGYQNVSGYIWYTRKNKRVKV